MLCAEDSSHAMLSADSSHIRCTINDQVVFVCVAPRMGDVVV